MALNPRVVSTFDHPHREQQSDLILGDAFMMDRGLVANSSLDGVFHWIKRSNYNPSRVEASHRQDLIGIDTAYQTKHQDTHRKRHGRNLKHYKMSGKIPETSRTHLL
jgi:hypothetical protein